MVLSTTTNPLVYRGIKEISEVAGINPKRFTYYVAQFGLPVFKIDLESNVWLATHDDLAKWVALRKQAYFEGL